MLHGTMSYDDLRILVNEALRHNQGDLVEIDRDLAEQLASAMETLVTLEGAEEKLGKRPRRSENQLDLF